MRSEDIQALISYRLQRAEESLQAAEIMRHNQMFTFAMNRIYYAMFYAVQAALVLSGSSFSKHGQVKAYLNRELIETGILPINDQALNVVIQDFKNNWDPYVERWNKWRKEK
jgi:uncharacterized protein (UPF0332 family)